MFNLKHWLNLATNPQTYIWIEVILIKETQKAILIEFDGQKIWIPKAWIVQLKRNKGSLWRCKPHKGEAISMKICEYHWFHGGYMC